jgi:dipeptidyl aminopeptidase/acylaminoacyl peptidase
MMMGAGMSVSAGAVAQGTIAAAAGGTPVETAVAAKAAQASTTEAPPTAAPRRWPIEAFARLPFMERPMMSPDGARFAARGAINGEQRLIIARYFAEGPEKDRLRMIGLGENDLNWWRWVNDDWLLVGVGGEQVVEGTPWYLTRTIAIKADGTKMNVLAKGSAAQNADDIIWVARDGTPRVLLSYQTSIYTNEPGFWPKVDEIDISTGRRRTVVQPTEHVMAWYADGAGAIRMGVGYDDARRSSKLLYRPGGSGGFRVVSRASRRKDERLIVPQLFLADPGKAIASDVQDGNEGLYELDLATLDIGKKIFDAPGYDLDGIVEDQSGSALAGVRYTADRGQVHWFDPTLAELQGALDKSVGADRRATIMSTSRDQQKLIVHVGGADRPGAFYYYDVANGRMNMTSFLNPDFRNGALAPVKTVRYKARDGLEIAAVLTLPQGNAAKDLPLILMPHGGPFARDSEEWDWWVQFLANRGYAVLQPNYRGSSGYGTAFAEKGEGQWGLAMQDDLNDAVDWAVAQGIADRKRVCVVGGSYGGYAAMRAAQRDGEKFRCAISYAGVSDLGAMMRYDSRFLNSGTRKDWMKEQAPDYRSVSPVNFAAGFSTPILLMHGKVDRRVPVQQSREMAEKLKAAGKVAGRDYIYVEQPLGDHFFSREADRLDFLQRMEAFLNEHNPA